MHSLEQQLKAGQRQQIVVELDALQQGQSRGAEEQSQASTLMQNLQ